MLKSMPNDCNDRGVRYGWQRENGANGHAVNRLAQTAPNPASDDDSSMSIDWGAEEGSEPVNHCFSEVP